ncbi:hypothetical protein KDK_01100 [Dictyobacter kobayashii]|uniref:Uncharacterized protein n=1 Tax=Dictyobacter kobayashii TaxID=2014872 RepID=A0A402AB14_9CHLR|nr:hypothetical protein KDK_01100 [Dictyobacter kobayashii]
MLWTWISRTYRSDKKMAYLVKYEAELMYDLYETMMSKMSDNGGTSVALDPDGCLV